MPILLSDVRQIKISHPVAEKKVYLPKSMNIYEKSQIMSNYLIMAMHNFKFLDYFSNLSIIYSYYEVSFYMPLKNYNFALLQGNQKVGFIRYEVLYI